MPQIKATPVNGARIRKENGALLKPEGEIVERTAFWLRRAADGDVALTAADAAEPAPDAEAPQATQTKSKK